MVNYLRIKNLTFEQMKPLVKNPMISKGYVDICYSGKNRNRSYISEEVMKEKLQPSVLGVPIVGEYFKEKEDFGDHGGKVVIDSKGVHYEATTIPYGFVPPNSNLSYIEKLDKDNITRKYLRADCFLWTGQYPECDRVIKSGNPQSMELEQDTGYWKRIDGQEYYVIEDAIISKLCILGSDVEPCFEGASFGEDLNISYRLNTTEYEEFIKTFTLEIKKALDLEKKEGGQNLNHLNNNETQDNKNIENEFVKQEEENKQKEKNKEEENKQKEKNKEEENKQDNKQKQEKDIQTQEEEKKQEDEKKQEEDEKLKSACGTKKKKEQYSEELEIEQLQNTIQTLQHQLNETTKLIKQLSLENTQFKNMYDELEKEKKNNLINQFKNKKIIDGVELENINKEKDSLTFEQLELKLCKIYTLKNLKLSETDNIYESNNFSVKTYTLNNEIPETSWEKAVQIKQSK